MPPAHTQSDLLTIEDYRATPEGTRYQLVEGELIMALAPNLLHQTICGNLYWLLRRHVGKKRLGRVFVAPCDVYLSPHDVVQPDVLFVAKSNLGILAEDGVHGAPDLVAEVLSPATAQLDARIKRRLYARHGVKEMWLVDPLLSQVQIYEFSRDAAKPVRLIDEGGRFTTTLLPGLVVSTVDVFKQ